MWGGADQLGELGLDQLPPTGIRFTAIPLRIEGMDTIPVRAFARMPTNTQPA